MTENDTSSAPLVGLWMLKEAFIADPQGRKIGPAFGANPKGTIAYMPNGRMTTVIADADQPRLSGDRLSAPVEERARAFSAASAYAGRYRFDGRTVVHTVEVCTNPNWVGTDVVRTVEFDGDQAIYRTEPQPLGGAETVVCLVWTRQQS
jgi:Lipocalin-like domain